MPDALPNDPNMDPILLSLGRVAASWSGLEYMIQRGIWEIANVEQYIGACITAQIISPGNKVRAYISLVSLWKPDESLTRKLNKFAQRVDALARQRNRFIHDPWVYNQTQGWSARLEVSADKKLSYGPIKTSPEELEAFRVEVSSSNQSFQLLHAEVLVALPSVARTRFEQSAGIAMVPPDVPE